VNVLAVEKAALGFWTVTFCGPEAISWVLVTCAVSEAAPPKVVASGTEFHSTADPLIKFVPVTVSAKGPLPETAEAGLSNVMVGPLTVNTLAADTPYASCTVTFCVPDVAS
jgi:hypothetical protein